MVTSEMKKKFQVPKNVFKICEILQHHDETGFLVGGSIRDLLSGSVPEDWDLATTATPEKMMKIFRKVIPTGIDHGTVTVLMGGDAFEVTTLRSEKGYSDGRHPDSVKFVTSIDDDLARRDFTINAIAWNPLSDTIHDPFGGREDLEKRRIIAVGDARQRFEEDGLRIMRAARFAATLEFEIEPSTLAAIATNAQRLENVSKERKRDEFRKLILANNPSSGLRILVDNHLFQYVCLGHPPEDPASPWEVPYDLVDAVPAVIHLRLSALWYNVPPAFLAEWLGRFLLDKRTGKMVSHLAVFFPFRYDESWSDIELRTLVSQVGKQYMADFLQLVDAHAFAGTISSDLAASFVQRLERLDWENSPLSIGELAVNGKDLIQNTGISPGPEVGALLQMLLEHVLERPAANEREKLLDFVRNRVL